MNWYSKKIEKEAVGGIYGAWLAPDGELVSVPNVNGHEDVGAAIIRSTGKKLPSNIFISEFLLKDGYCRLVLGNGVYSVSYLTALSDIQVKKLINLYKGGNYNQANISSSGGEKTAKDIYDLHAALEDGVFANVKNKGITRQSEALYGHWIDPTGKIHDVDEYQGHWRITKDIFSKMGEELTGDEKLFVQQLMGRGWARTAYDSEFMIINSESTMSDAQAEDRKSVV